MMMQTDDGGTVASYNKHSATALQVDAHLTVIESALKGYTKWKADVKPETPEVSNALETQELLLA
jgi:hypothetical protein